MIDDTTEAVIKFEALGRAGFNVSVCCGPSGTWAFRWSVYVTSPDGEEFEKPYGANDFAHAIEIAEAEIARRGWR